MPSLGGTPGRNEKTILTYGEVRLPFNLLLRTEYLRQTREAGDPNVDALYSKVKWQMNDLWYLNYRWNAGVDEKRGLGGRQIANVFTLGFAPRPNVRTKVEFSSHEFRNELVEDFKSWQGYIGYVF